MKVLRDLLPLTVTQYDTIDVPLCYGAPKGHGGCFGPIKQRSAHITSFTVPTNSYLKVSDWIPIRRPVEGEVWYGVERYLDNLRLAGVIYPGRSDHTLEENFVNGWAYANREGANIDYVFVPVALYAQVSTYRSVYGKPKFIASDEITNEIILVQSDTWKKYPNTITCSAPGWNMRILLPKPT